MYVQRICESGYSDIVVELGGFESALSFLENSRDDIGGGLRLLSLLMSSRTLPDSLVDRIENTLAYIEKRFYKPIYANQLQDIRSLLPDEPGSEEI